MTAPVYEIKVSYGLTKRCGVDRVKRMAVRRCRAMTKAFGHGATGEVRLRGTGRIYHCYAIDEDGRTVVNEDTP